MLAVGTAERAVGDTEPQVVEVVQGTNIVAVAQMDIENSVAGNVHFVADRKVELVLKTGPEVIRGGRQG